MEYIAHDWNGYQNIMYEQVVQAFRRTDYYCALSEQAEEAESAYRKELNDTEIRCLENMLEKMLTVEDAKGYYAYVQGYRDCVALLKRLNVL